MNTCIKVYKPFTVSKLTSNQCDMVNSCLMGLEICQKPRGREGKGGVSRMLGGGSVLLTKVSNAKSGALHLVWRLQTEWMEAPNEGNGGAIRELKRGKKYPSPQHVDRKDYV